MINVKTNTAVTIRSGLIKLTDTQAKRRSSSLQPDKSKGVYRILNAIQLKAGEEFGLDEIPKSMEMDMAEIPKPAKQADKED